MEANSEVLAAITIGVPRRTPTLFLSGYAKVGPVIIPNLRAFNSVVTHREAILWGKVEAFLGGAPEV